MNADDTFNRNLLIKNILFCLEKINKRMKSASKEAGLGETYITDLVKGRVIWPTINSLNKISNYVGYSTYDLINVDLTTGNKLPDVYVKVTGFIGLNGQVFSMQNISTDMNIPTEVELASGIKKTKDLEVLYVYEDDLPLPIEKGSILYHYKVSSETIEECIGKYCIVQLEGGNKYVRRLLKGVGENYQLMKYNGALQDNVKIIGAAKIKSILF